jgi:hypothetical protein
MQRLRDDDTTQVGLEMMTAVRHIADARASIQERAEAITNALDPVVPFAANWVGVLDPAHNRPMTLTASAHNTATDAYLRSTEVLDDIEMVGIDRSA